MQLSEFDYTLPKKLIAQTALEPRDHSRLLMLDKKSGNISHKKFYNILDELSENDVLVLNKTHVIKARLKGEIISPLSPEGEGSGVRAEIFLHKQISENTWDCLVFPGKKLKPGKKVSFESPLSSEGEGVPTKEAGVRSSEEKSTLIATIEEVSHSGRIVQFNKSGQNLFDAIEKIGNIPLPPYIKASENDDDRYQTVFHDKKSSGSVAAPTASLHFTEELLDKIVQKGVKIEKVLLHVGLGTFADVKTDNIKEHHMHSEFIHLEEDVAKRLNTYKKQGKRIISVGTTSTRVLETMSNENGVLQPGKKETDIFIYPGYEWKFVDSLITNFHLPKSTLLMLVSSLAGEENIKKAYQEAIEKKYRFFSFGDAMWIR